MRSVAPPGTWRRSYVPAHGGSQQLTDIIIIVGGGGVVVVVMVFSREGKLMKILEL